MKKIYFIIFILYLNCYAYDTPVHTYITSKAFEVLTYYFPVLSSSELAQQLGTSSSTGTRSWETGLIQTGVIREDIQDIVYGYGPPVDETAPEVLAGLFTDAPTATVTHFWKADYGDNYQTPYLNPLRWFMSYPNAYTKANKYLNGGWKLYYLVSGSRYIKEYTYYSLIDLVKTGTIYQTGYLTLPTCDYTPLYPIQAVTLNSTDRKRFAYEILGRLLHLLQDMSVPAHVHGDRHWPDKDTYEEWITHNYAYYGFNDVLNAGGFVDFNCDNPLKYLFYSANQIADIFPSNDDPGNTYLAQGTYQIINQYYSMLNYTIPAHSDLSLCASINLVYSIRACASFLLWFCQQTDMLKTLTLNSNYASYLQIRNPATTGTYYWKPLPYSLDFSNTITVDLMADPWPIGHAWSEWQQRNKRNIRMGSCQEYEWQNASASVTSTFTAYYDPLFTLSLSPVIYEGQSSNGYYSNLTTGEVSSVFQLRKDYAYTVQASAPTGYNFAYWSDRNLSNPRSFRINSNNSGLYAVFKASLKSSNSNAFFNNSSRKFVRTADGNLHCVYESMGKVWYETSNNNGTTWIIKNYGNPLSFSNAKNASITTNGQGSTVLIAFQEQRSDGLFNIRLIHYNYNTDVILDDQLVNDYLRSNNYSFDAQPIVYSHFDQLNGFIILWKDGTGPYFNQGFYYRQGYISSNGFYPQFINFLEENFTYLQGTDQNSINPSIYGGEQSGYIYFHLAWQQNNQIKYGYLRTTGAETATVSSILSVSTSSGFSSNFRPSLIAAGSGARLSWIGWRMIDEEYFEQRVVFVDPSNLSRYWNFGTNVQSTSINKSNDCYSITWARSNSLPIQFTDSYTLSSITTMGNLIGKDVQLSNGASRTTMRAMAFNSNSQPYYLNSNQLYLSKPNFTEIGKAREGVVCKDNAQFYFAIGDIRVNDQPIKFVEFDDTVSFYNNKRLNEFLVSEPFDLGDNSNFSYSVQYGITDSAAAAKVLGSKDFINFQVELIDDKHDRTIGIFDNIKYTQSNVDQYQNITYQVDTRGVGNKAVRLRLVTENNFDSKFALTDRYAESSALPKAAFKQINFEGSLEVKEYALEQNYPNPFNPSTQINYQIKEDGLVTLKLYDILGAEIKTLVNESKNKGRYTYTFNGSDLPSGVYIYQLKVNDFVYSKKLMLLK